MAEATVTLASGSEAETSALGLALAAWLEPGDLILLGGDFGAGKTVFVKGLGAGLGIHGEVASPSFALIHEYAAGPGRQLRRLYHLDLYRLGRAAEVAGLGLDDYLADEGAAVVIEWPDVALEALPGEWLRIELVPDGPTQRTLIVGARGARHRSLLSRWVAAAPPTEAVAEPATTRPRRTTG